MQALRRKNRKKKLTKQLETEAEAPSEAPKTASTVKTDSKPLTAEEFVVVFEEVMKKYGYTK